MSEENQVEQNEAADEREPMPLVERLERCKSRKAARESIADYCEDIGVDPKDYALSSECLFILQSLR